MIKNGCRKGPFISVNVFLLEYLICVFYLMSSKCIANFAIKPFAYKLVCNSGFYNNENKTRRHTNSKIRACRLFENETYKC